MTWFEGVVTYVLLWWTALFAVLPWGNRAPADLPLGHAGSAPENPRLLLKFLVTTGVAAILWGIVYALIRAEIIDFRELAARM